MGEKMDPKLLQLEAVLDMCSAISRDQKKVEISDQDLFYVVNMAFVGSAATFAHILPSQQDKDEAAAMMRGRIEALCSQIGDADGTTDRTQIVESVAVFAQMTDRIICDRLASVLCGESEEQAE